MPMPKVTEIPKNIKKVVQKHPVAVGATATAVLSLAQAINSFYLSQLFYQSGFYLSYTDTDELTSSIEPNEASGVQPYNIVRWGTASLVFSTYLLGIPALAWAEKREFELVYLATVLAMSISYFLVLSASIWGGIAGANANDNSLISEPDTNERLLSLFEMFLLAAIHLLSLGVGPLLGKLYHSSCQESLLPGPGAAPVQDYGSLAETHGTFSRPVADDLPVDIEGRLNAELANARIVKQKIKVLRKYAQEYIGNEHFLAKRQDGTIDTNIVNVAQFLPDNISVELLTNLANTGDYQNYLSTLSGMGIRVLERFYSGVRFAMPVIDVEKRMTQELGNATTNQGRMEILQKYHEYLNLALEVPEQFEVLDRYKDPVTNKVMDAPVRFNGDREGLVYDVETLTQEQMRSGIGSLIYVEQAELKDEISNFIETEKNKIIGKIEPETTKWFDEAMKITIEEFKNSVIDRIREVERGASKERSARF